MSTVFALNPSDWQGLKNIYDSLGTDQNSNWSTAYQYVLNLISNADGTGPIAGMSASEWLWIKGAMQVNLNQGPLSDFIRDYTEETILIKGHSLGGVSLNQSAALPRAA